MVATDDHCYFCFDVLLHHFDEHKATPPDPSFPDDSYPLFVTWLKERSSSEDTNLRGCIGTFSSQKIHRGLQEYALTSALRDRRFNPITKHEVPRLHCAVSLLTDFEEADSVWSWEIDTHGVRIDFTDSSGTRHNATYLPEVASQQGWNKREVIDSLVAKAGYKGRINDRFRENINLTRYQTSKSVVSYSKYAAAGSRDNTSSSSRRRHHHYHLRG